MEFSLVLALMNESRWIAPSMAVAGFLAFMTWRGSDREGDDKTAASMCVYAGAMVGAMAFGHLVAVTLGLGTGLLRAAPLRLYAIGVTLAIPSLWVFVHGRALARDSAVLGRTTVMANGALVLALLVSGLPNLALAIPAILTMAFASVQGVAFRRTLAILTVAVAMALFAGSVVFFVGGRSFEDFSGMETTP